MSWGSPDLRSEQLRCHPATWIETAVIYVDPFAVKAGFVRVLVDLVPGTLFDMDD